MKTCPHCGQLIKSDAVICPYCGYQQSRISRDEHSNHSYTDPDQNEGQRTHNVLKYSKAKLTGLDWIALILNVLDAGTLFFLGVQGLIRPFYINNVGTFVTVILSLFGFIAICFQIHQNRVNRLPNWASFVAMIGDLSVFFMIFMFNQRVLLISLVILVVALLMFDHELRKTY